jgi:hypothetical protein
VLRARERQHGPHDQHNGVHAKPLERKHHDRDGEQDKDDS